MVGLDAWPEFIGDETEVTHPALPPFEGEWPDVVDAGRVQL
jgi:hypothetical protein